jgi:hypothetical protein
LPLGRYRLHWQALEVVRLPPFAGSAWRGAFGHALKRLVCVTREPVCPDCLLFRSCLYPYLFETPPDPAVGKLTRYTAAPHPFVLRPGPVRSQPLAPEEELVLEVILFGQGNRLLPYVIHALERAGQRGLGSGAGRLQLERVAQATADETGWRVLRRAGEPLQAWQPVELLPPPCPVAVKLVVETPLRLKREEHNVTPESFEFAALFGNLLRRISLLTAFHTETPLETDFAGLMQRARAVRSLGTRLRWQDWTRYSSRQGRPVQMGGVVGEITLAGAEAEAELASFWPYLWLGQWTHAGKGTSMGLGQYRVVIE